MFQDFLSQNKMNLTVLALILLAAGSIGMSYYSKHKRRARRRQAFQEKLRQHQEALLTQQEAENSTP